MNDERELVTVFRSADPSAEEDAEQVRSLLDEAGLHPTLLGDDSPGVPSGACEVRVPDNEADRADQVIGQASELEQPKGDPSSDMDLETVFSEMGASADVEVLGVRSVLDANNIPNVYVNPSQYPNLRFVVKVPKKFVAQALQALEEARAAGPVAAEAAEEESEQEGVSPDIP